MKASRALPTPVQRRERAIERGLVVQRADGAAARAEIVVGDVVLAMVVGGEKNLRMLVIWSVAAAASLLAFRYLPENSHVVVGALAGGATGLLWKEKARES